VTGIELYDTRTRTRRSFVPIEPGRVRMYSCGPTVYGPPHIGNLRSRLFSDLLKRFLLAEGFEVVHVINITDVGHLVSDADEGEDKIEAAARRTGKSAEEIAAHFTQVWRDDGAAVNCLPPEHNPKATEHIPEQIDLARKLEAGGYLYRIADGLYFDTSRFPRYAELARLDLAGQSEGARIGVTEGKRNPADFAVWKFAEAGVQRLQEWDSPWGRGFPGWHLECSAMAVRYLGPHFDIHTGGIDLASVHHTNEVAQSECGYGVHPWVEFWMHNEFLDMGSEKMSKSKGNVRTLSDLVAKGIDPLAFRYFFLQAHYRQQQSFSDEAIESAATGYRRLQGVAKELGVATDPKALDPLSASEEAAAEPYRERFRAALADDLNGAFKLVSEFKPAGDQPGPSPRSARASPRREAPDPPRGHRLGQDLHRRQVIAAQRQARRWCSPPTRRSRRSSTPSSRRSSPRTPSSISSRTTTTTSPRRTSPRATPSSRRTR
jgi:cysteinyl-tRNA synthetase